MKSDKDKNPFFDEEETGGRPRMLLNERGAAVIKRMAEIMCTNEEIADVLGVGVDLITNDNNNAVFQAAKREGQVRGKMSLRRKQFALAEKNANMAIFLGKNYLDQKDKQEVESTLICGLSFGFDDELMG